MMQSGEAVGSHSHCILTSQGPGGPPSERHGLMILVMGVTSWHNIMECTGS